MSKNYTIVISDEVESALIHKAEADGITTQELVESQIDYYLACALHDHLDPNHPVNTPGLSIKDRLEVYAIGVNEDEAAARTRITELREGV